MRTSAGLLEGYVCESRGVFTLCVHYTQVYINHGPRIPSPLSLHVAKTGRNHLNEEFTPLLSTGIGDPNL